MNASGKVFITIISAVIFFAVATNFSRQGAANANAPDKEPQTEQIVTPVKLTTVTQRTFAETLNVYAKVEAIQSSLVSPKISGIVEKLHVDEGSVVEKNKTILFELDNHKLKQKVASAKQNIPIVLAVKKERISLLRKSEVDLSKKQSSFNRYKSLFNRKAVTKEAFDNQEADYLIALADVDHKKAILELGQAEAQQAIINLEMAQRDLADSVIVSPIDGHVSEKHIEVGEMAQPGRTALRIDNTSKLQICAFIPAEYSHRIIENSTLAKLSIFEQTFDQDIAITYVSPVIDPSMQVFEIKCQIDSDKVSLKPGQSVQLTIKLDEEAALSVPTSALISEGGEAYLFAYDRGVARRMTVKKGRELNGWTEIMEPQLEIDSPIIFEGQFLLSDNSPVKAVE